MSSKHCYRAFDDVFSMSDMIQDLYRDAMSFLRVRLNEILEKTATRLKPDKERTKECCELLHQVLEIHCLSCVCVCVCVCV